MCQIICKSICCVRCCIISIKTYLNIFSFYSMLSLCVLFLVLLLKYLNHAYKYRFVLFEMIETCCWILLFIVVFIIVHYQFKYCIPVGLVVIKFLETCVIVFFIRIYITYRVYNNKLDWISMYNDLKSFYTEL